jgi:hypothetical protein
VVAVSEGRSFRTEPISGSNRGGSARYLSKLLEEVPADESTSEPVSWVWPCLVKEPFREPYARDERNRHEEHACAVFLNVSNPRRQHTMCCRTYAAIQS